MRRVLWLMATVTAAAGVLVGPARPAGASWVSDKCYKDNSVDDHVKRSEAQAYAVVGEFEGYEWGGGCWNDNDRDDTPGDPDSGGEGPDCSGFVFKTWEMKSTEHKSGFIWWNKLQDIHGPYATLDYHAPEAADPFFKLTNWQDRTVTLYMDAFAKEGHVGMLYTSVNPSPNTDWIIEALGDAYGVNVNEQDYRYDSRYVGIRREQWTQDCWPQCGGPGSEAPVILP